MIVSAGNQESFSFATPIGIGIVQSAINLTKICLLKKPRSLVFIGSAGSYKHYKPFDIVQSTSAKQIELSVLDNNSYTPINNSLQITSDIITNDITVNSSNYITTCDTLSKQLLTMGVGIENMEFFSVLSVAKTFGLLAGGIFVITNYTNTNAHNDFMTNHNRAMELLIDYLTDNRWVATHS